MAAAFAGHREASAEVAAPMTEVFAFLDDHLPPRSLQRLPGRLLAGVVANGCTRQMPAGCSA